MTDTTLWHSKTNPAETNSAETGSAEIDPAAAPSKVRILRDEFIDESRGGRVVPFKLYYPVDPPVAGPLPVVVWSHGLGGSRDGAGFLSRYISGYGYIVVNVQHHGTDDSLWRGKPGHPWDVIRNTKLARDASLNRYLDVPFLLDRLTGWRDQNSKIGDMMDMQRLGMSGHSFGALTTQIMAGQKRGRGENLVSLKDPRFRAGIAYSPVLPSNRDEPPQTIYGSIDIPLLHFTGTKDDSPTTGHGYEERLQIFDHAAGPNQHLVVLDDGDHMVFAGSRGQLEENPKRAVQEDIICKTSLAFWEAYLRDNKAARLWLTEGGYEAWVGDEARIRHRGLSG